METETIAVLAAIMHNARQDEPLADTAKRAVELYVACDAAVDAHAAAQDKE